MLLELVVSCASEPARPATKSTDQPLAATAAQPETLAAQRELELPLPRDQLRPAAKPPAPVEAQPLGCSSERRLFADTGLDEDALLEELRTAPARVFKPVGTTSVVFRVALGARRCLQRAAVDPEALETVGSPAAPQPCTTLPRQGEKTHDSDHPRALGPILKTLPRIAAAFKPSSRTRRRAAFAEIAAYRLARCLGLRNVVPAIGRRLPIGLIKQRLKPDDRWPAIEQQLELGQEQALTGAAMYWVPDLRDIGIDRRQGIREWSGWLAVDGVVPENRRVLARDISNMLVFDYLIANWDRFSGSNALAQHGTRLVLRDHDVAFPEHLPLKLHRKLLARLLRAQRFSRGLIARLAALSPPALAREIGRDPVLRGRRWLHGKRLAGLLDRRQAVLSHVAALVDLHGEDGVLAFP